VADGVEKMIESDRINGLRGAYMKRHPNILLIVAERIRYDCIGSSQMRISKTPYLDWLAGNGVWFEQAYTPHPNYGLAQMAMLTGSRADSDIHELIARAYGTDKCKKLAGSSWSAWLKDQKWLCSWLGKWDVPGCVPADFGYEHITANTMSPPSELAQAAVEWLHANGQQGLPWHLCLNFLIICLKMKVMISQMVFRFHPGPILRMISNINLWLRGVCRPDPQLTVICGQIGLCVPATQLNRRPDLMRLPDFLFLS
jgi:hypothetical protein